MTKSSYNYIDNYLSEIQAKGRYSVTFDELKNHFNTSEKAVLQNIYRLKRKNRLAQVRKEFYVIIPPRYSNRGMVPPSLFIADMMQFLNRDYYVGLFSAAALHGSGYQQPMEFQVMTRKPPLRNIINQKLSIIFFTKRNWDTYQISEKKTETGYLNISSPELTAFDLVQYHKRIGGLNRIIPILDGLTETIKSSMLSKTARTQKLPNIQRMGYLLEKLDNESFANYLQKIIGDKSNYIPLSLTQKEKKGTINEKWKVFINTQIEF